MKKFIAAALALALLTVGVIGFARTATTHAAVGKNDVCAGLDAAVGAAGSCDTPSGGKTVEGTLATLIRIFSWIVGVAAVIMVMVGGFQYVTSGGDSGKVTSAKNTIMYSLIGVVIAVLAQVIVKFVLSKV